MFSVAVVRLLGSADVVTGGEAEAVCVSLLVPALESVIDSCVCVCVAAPHTGVCV